MNHKDQALRIAYTAFRTMAEGGTYTPKELRLLGDLCALALPMKYRFSRAELDAMKKFQPTGETATTGDTP